MSRREDHYTDSEHEAGRFERAHDEGDYVRINGRLVPADEVPDRSDVEDR